MPQCYFCSSSESRGQEKPCPFPVLPEGFLRDKEVFLSLSGFTGSSSLPFSREEQTWPLRIGPGLQITPCLWVFVHVPSPRYLHPVAHAGPGRAPARNPSLGCCSDGVRAFSGEFSGGGQQRSRGCVIPHVPFEAADVLVHSVSSEPQSPQTSRQLDWK